MEDSQDELRAEVERTRADYRESLARFRAIAEPCGVPFPDGVQRVSVAGQEVRHALAEYTHAVQRENEFLVNRALDDDSDPTENSE